MFFSVVIPARAPVTRRRLLRLRPCLHRLLFPEQHRIHPLRVLRPSLRNRCCSRHSPPVIGPPTVPPIRSSPKSSTSLSPSIRLRRLRRRLRHRQPGRNSRRSWAGATGPGGSGTGGGGGLPPP